MLQDNHQSNLSELITSQVCELSIQIDESASQAIYNSPEPEPELTKALDIKAIEPEKDDIEEEDENMPRNLVGLESCLFGVQTFDEVLEVLQREGGKKIVL